MMSETAASEVHNNDLDRSLILQKNILRLQIPMHDVLRVAVGDGHEHLFQYDGCISFTVVWLLNDLVEELSSSALFRDDKVSFGVLVHFKESHNVGVVLQI